MNGADRPSSGDWYEIRVKGHLAGRWAAWLDAELSQDQDGTTVVRLQVRDQAELHGLLTKLRDLGLPLVSVIETDHGSTARTSRDTSPTPNRSTT